jgi:hypothetical protein
LGFRVVLNQSRFGIDSEIAIQAIGDVSEMAQLGADVAFGDFRIQFGVASDGVQEVFEVNDIGGRLGLDAIFRNQFSFRIKNFVSAATSDRERAIIAVERDEIMLLMSARVAGAAFPGDADFAEIIYWATAVSGVSWSSSKW